MIYINHEFNIPKCHSAEKDQTGIQYSMIRINVRMDVIQGLIFLNIQIRERVIIVFLQKTVIKMFVTNFRKKLF